jgi:hypothetical protein
MRTGRIGKTVLAGIVTLGFVLGSAGPAAAADGWQSTQNVPDSEFNNGHVKKCLSDYYNGRICFQPYGDYFWLKDENANGLPIAVEWNLYTPNYDDTGRGGVIYDAHGADAGWTRTNKDFPEGYVLEMRGCDVLSIAHEDLDETECSEWVYFYNDN